MKFIKSNYIIKQLFSIQKHPTKQCKVITILGFKLSLSSKSSINKWAKKIKKDQSQTTQDSYLLFDSLTDKNIECIDAYSLFCHMREKGLNAYYILLKQNKLYNHLKKNNNLENIVVLNHSVKQDEDYFFQTLYTNLIKTKAIITSMGESGGFNRFFKSNSYWKYIFIQHGKTYLKESVMNKYVTPNKFDKVLISSDYEADIFKKHGFKDDKFIKVGLPRWDLLRENNPYAQKSILFMFTWRRLTQSQFDKSYYKKNLLSLLHDPDLHEYLTKYDVTIYFAPHHALKHNSGINFEVIHPNIKIVDTTEISKQIKQSSMLVTDYSSIVFDFIFQDKPAVLYVLDDGDPVLQKHEQIENQLLKTKQDKLPNILFSKDDVINKIKYYIENNFKPEEETLSKYQKFFYTKDNIREKITNELEKICK